MSHLEQTITELVAPALAAKDLELVQVRVVDGAQRKTLQILVDNTRTGAITLDECALASQTISAILDVEDVVAGAFNLEVGSPGIDRPLIKRADFERFIGFDAKLEVKLPIDGRKRFKGPLKSLVDDQLTICVDLVDYAIDLENIAQAKLVLTEALIQAHRDRQQPPADAAINESLDKTTA